jgi:DNA-binding LacI/PurR family transcriptional regulator
MTITLKDVAERAGVSRAAVSRTFTPGASVSARTRAKVEEAAAALGYSPNMLARSLTTRRTQLIGLVSNNFRNPVFLQIFDLFTRAIQDRGFRPLLVNLTDEDDPDRSVRLLRQYSVDGVIVASSHVRPGFARAFREAGTPVVHTFGRATAEPEVDVVAIDNVGAGRMAAATLLARGYRRLGFLGGPEHASTTLDRLAGFSAGARAGGAELAVHFAGAYGFEAGRQGMARALAQSRPEAWFCADDILSIGAMAAATEAGLTVPGDMGVIGLNDIDMAAWANVALTTIHQPFEAMVLASISLLAASLADPGRKPEAQLFPCHIVERRTLRPLPGPSA